jgi:hypothetical protein
MNVETHRKRIVSSFIGLEGVPETIRSLSLFAEPDYIDCFVLEVCHASDNTPEDWARAVLERAAISQRNARRLWTLMGLRLGPPHSPHHVQGWKIERRSGEWLRLETASWYLSANAVAVVEEDEVSVSLSLRYDARVAPFIWALISGPHQRAVPVMMRQAADLLAK